jgi:hypothetical protein
VRTGSRPTSIRATAGLVLIGLVPIGLGLIGCGPSPDSPGAQTTASPPATPSATATSTPPDSVSAVVTAEQVTAVRNEATKQGAVITFSRTDPSGIVVVRPTSGPGERIDASSLADVVRQQGDPVVEVKVASTGSRQKRLAKTFEQYAASHSRPGVYVTFKYRKEYSVFTLDTNAPPESLTSLLGAHGGDLVVTYATPGCQVCGG